MPIELFNWLLTPEASLAAALLIFLAGLSEGVGSRGVVLLINRISPPRFIIGLLTSALLFLVSAALWVAGLWLVFGLLFRAPVPLGAFFVAVSVAYAPLLLGALRLLPLLGPLLGALLRLWSFAVAVAAIVAVTGLGLWESVAGALLGSLLVEGARWLLSEPAEELGRDMLFFFTGRRRLLLRREPPLVIPGYEPGEVK